MLFLVLVVYIAATIRVGRADPKGPEITTPPDHAVEHGEAVGSRLLAFNVALVAAGVGLLVVGAIVLVRGATSIATALGLSELVIGLTVVAVGTSLPELATTVVAVRRGERDLAVGNVVGSNIFNLGAVLGLAALFSPGGITVPGGAANFDFILMTGVALLLLPVLITGLAVARWEGVVFLAYYAAYTGYLLLAATEHAALRPYSVAMLAFVVPLTVLILVMLALAELRRRRPATEPAGTRAPG